MLTALARDLNLNDNDIFESFKGYFELINADTEDLQNEVYKLRYQVYCIEKKFERCEDYPDYRETDIFDSHSSHYLIRHRKTGVCAATTRLILPNPSNINDEFPIELHANIDNFDLLKGSSRQQVAELSRFCVSKQFRQRQNEQHLLSTYDVDVPDGFSHHEKRSSSHLTLALFACALQISANNDIHYWYALMEPALKRFFSTLGVHFTAVGPIVDYHGKRIPCVIKVSDLLASVAKKDMNYWNMLTNYGALKIGVSHDQLKSGIVG